MGRHDGKFFVYNICSRLVVTRGMPSHRTTIKFFQEEHYMHDSCLFNFHLYGYISTRWLPKIALKCQ